MTTYFASQGGEGLYHGTNPANAWAVPSIPWASLNPNDTLFLLDTITSTITITEDFGESGSLIIRGDYAGREGILDGQDTLSSLIRIETAGYSGYTFQGLTLKNASDSATSCLLYLNCTNNVIVQGCVFRTDSTSAARGLIATSTPTIGFSNLTVTDSAWQSLEIAIQLEINTTQFSAICRNIEISENGSSSVGGHSFLECVIPNAATHQDKLYPTGINVLDNTIINTPYGISALSWGSDGASTSSIAYNWMINSGGMELLGAEGGMVHNNRIDRGGVILSSQAYPCSNVKVFANNCYSANSGTGIGIVLGGAVGCDVYCNILDKCSITMAAIRSVGSRVYNNLIMDTNLALYIADTNTSLVFKNNIILRNKKTLELEAGAPEPDWDYNGCYYNEDSSHTPGINDVNQPGAVGIDNKLSSNSLYAGKGTNEFSPLIDYEGATYEVFHLGPYATLSNEVTLSYNIADLSWLESSPDTWTDYAAISWNSARTYLHYIDVDSATGIDPVKSDTMIMEREYFENLSFSDMFTNPTVQKISESLGIEDTSITFSILKELQEQFKVLSDFERVLFIDLTNRLAISFHIEDDKFIGARFHIQGLDELFEVVDDLTLNYGLNMDEYITILSDYIRSSANGTVSTIFITGKPFTNKDEFMRTVIEGHIPDYSKFSTFIQGNYEYQQALFKTTMIPTETSNQVKLSALKLTVDLVDINNSGSGEIKAAATGFVAVFDRPYTRTDNIHIRAIQTSGASQTSGTGYGIPEITSITKQGCTIKLRETSGDYIVGFVSWTATGD
jgi:hypothetical protein